MHNPALWLRGPGREWRRENHCIYRYVGNSCRCSNSGPASSAGSGAPTRRRDNWRRRASSCSTRSRNAWKTPSCTATERARLIDPLLYQRMVEQSRDYALFILDPSGRIMSWNLGAERLKGYAADEIIGRHFSTFYTREAVESGWPAHELQVATFEGRFEDEGWRVRKDGSRFWANVIITALRDDA